MNPKPKPNYWLLLVFLFLCTPAPAMENFLSGSRMAAISNCGVALPDIWSVAHNQAGLAFLEHTSIAINHQQRFLMKELGMSNLALVLPFKGGTFGFHSSYFGYSKYHESKAGLSYALKLGQKIAAGIQFDYFRSSIPSNTYISQSFTFEAGLMAMPLENLTMGFHVFNPIPEKWLKNEETEFPLVTRMGVAYLFENSFQIFGEIKYHSKAEKMFIAGLEYFAYKSFALRAGISGGEIQYSFGLGYTIKKLRFDIAFTKHRILGTSPSIDFIYEW